MRNKRDVLWEDAYKKTRVCEFERKLNREFAPHNIRIVNGSSYESTLDGMTFIPESSQYCYIDVAPRALLSFSDETLHFTPRPCKIADLKRVLKLMEDVDLEALTKRMYHHSRRLGNVERYVQIWLVTHMTKEAQSSHFVNDLYRRARKGSVLFSNLSKLV